MRQNRLIWSSVSSHQIEGIPKTSLWKLLPQFFRLFFFCLYIRSQLLSLLGDLLGWAMCFFFLAPNKRSRLYNTSSAISSQHSSRGRDIWSVIPKSFQHLTKTIRHRWGGYATASAARHRGRVLIYCVYAICCCCKSVCFWSRQTGKDFGERMRDTEDFSERRAVGAASVMRSYFTPIQQDVVVASSILGDPSIQPTFAWVPQQERAEWRASLSDYTHGRNSTNYYILILQALVEFLLWFVNWEVGKIIHPDTQRSFFFQSTPVKCVRQVQRCILNAGKLENNQNKSSTVFRLMRKAERATRWCTSRDKWFKGHILLYMSRLVHTSEVTMSWISKRRGKGYEGRRGRWKKTR